MAKSKNHTNHNQCGLSLVVGRIRHRLWLVLKVVHEAYCMWTGYRKSLVLVGSYWSVIMQPCSSLVGILTLLIHELWVSRGFRNSCNIKRATVVMV